MNAGPYDDTANLDPRPIQRSELTHLQNQYGVCAWFGFFTRHWWALVDSHPQADTVYLLIEAKTPQQLGERIQTARGWK